MSETKSKFKPPLVAIVGRTNVGKSTLFNRITGSRRAIVGDEPGITRDRLYSEVNWDGRLLRVVDTGGIVPDDKALIPAKIFRQARVALEESNAVVMVVDARTELASSDLELARLISDRLALVLAEQPPRRARGPGQASSVESESPPGSTLDSAEDRSADMAAEPLDELPQQRFSRMHVGVIGVLLILGLLTAGWLLLRARPVAVASSGEVVTVSTPLQSAPTASPTASERATRLVVHVLGAVRHPGLVRLPENSRVQDAIEAAGGLTGRADPGELNLAQPLVDGQQVVIGTAGDPVGEVRDGRESGAGSGPSAKAALDLNRANQAQLEELPGIGPVTAGAILGWRQQHGRFSRIEELQEVDGIGPKTYAQIAPHVRV